MLVLTIYLASQATSVLNPLSAVCGRVGLQAKCCTIGIVSTLTLLAPSMSKY